MTPAVVMEVFEYPYMTSTGGIRRYENRCYDNQSRTARNALVLDRPDTRGGNVVRKLFPYRDHTRNKIVPKNHEKLTAD